MLLGERRFLSRNLFLLLHFLAILFTYFGAVYYVMTFCVNSVLGFNCCWQQRNLLYMYQQTWKLGVGSPFLQTHFLWKCQGHHLFVAWCPSGRQPRSLTLSLLLHQFVLATFHGSSPSWHSVWNCFLKSAMAFTLAYFCQNMPWHEHLIISSYLW